MVYTPEQEIIDWLDEGLRSRNLREADLARLSGLSKPTINRLHTKGRSGKNPPTMEQMIALSNALQRPMPPSYAVITARIDGFSEPEVTRIEQDTVSPNLSVWTLKSDALAGAGFLPNDILQFDARVKPERGDVVIANVYRRQGADTVIRIWMPPFLVAAEPGVPRIAPVEIKDEDEPKAVILGTMVDLHRTRRARAA